MNDRNDTNSKTYFGILVGFITLALVMVTTMDISTTLRYSLGGVLLAMLVYLVAKLGQKMRQEH